MKKWLAIGLFVLIYIVLIVTALRIITLEDTWTCDSNGQWLKHGHPSSSQPTGNCDLENILAQQGRYIIIFIFLIVIIIIWESVWKLIALWHCGRNNQLVWFIVIAILNTAGFLPLFYYLFFRRRR